MRILTDPQQIERMLERRAARPSAEEPVRSIIRDVREHGDEALIRMAEQFDGAKLAALRVTPEEIENAIQLVPDRLMEALKAAELRIRRFHEQQLQESWEYTPEPGVLLGQLVQPIGSAGIYIPGGKASYPSTVLMNALPARIAGVERIVLITPPRKDGSVNPAVLAAADLCGITEIFKSGGAQAIAALAYGTESIPRVDKITGPGNAYVACAKKLVQGDTGIDMIAGPSEVCIWSDDQADPAFIAADLLAQAEHDEQAAACCIAESAGFAERIRQEVRRQLEQLERNKIAAKAIEDNGWIAVVPDQEQAVRLINELAPEHLEIMTERPEEQVRGIRNAGAIFLGPYSPEALGDYMAGPNHTLPTNGTAKFSSPLGVQDFTKRTSVIRYDKEALQKTAEHIMVIAEAEELGGHAASIAIRTKGGLL